MICHRNTAYKLDIMEVFNNKTRLIAGAVLLWLLRIQIFLIHPLSPFLTSNLRHHVSLIKPNNMTRASGQVQMRNGFSTCTCRWICSIHSNLLHLHETTPTIRDGKIILPKRCSSNWVRTSTTPCCLGQEELGHNIASGRVERMRRHNRGWTLSESV